jgi:hypothetical protein
VAFVCYDMPTRTLMDAVIASTSAKTISSLWDALYKARRQTGDRVNPRKRRLPKLAGTPALNNSSRLRGAVASKGTLQQIAKVNQGYPDKKSVSTYVRPILRREFNDRTDIKPSQLTFRSKNLFWLPSCYLI